MDSFDHVEFELIRDKYHLTCYWGNYSVTFAGYSQAECLNKLLIWHANR